MLYRTHHHPFLYTFNPFSPSSLSPHLLSSSSPRLQEMECVQGAFINSFGPEMLKTAAFADDLLVVNGGSHGVSGDDLFVDELLDFSNDFEQEEEQQPQQQLEEQEKEQDRKTECSVLHEKLSPPAPENSAVSANDDFGSLPESELSVPAEGLESLEWLSHFVEESFSDYSLTGKLPPKPVEKRPEKEVAASEQPCFTTPVQTKARTKRARTGSQTGESFLGKPAAKKQKKKPADGYAGGGGTASQPRRCSHCGVTKTPQWRAGPLGSKTLCNACGVRYKSGRLLPEYRPACSPTFSSEVHSNNHRKVMEMRRKRESETEVDGLVQPPIPNF
ncbi:hypothetical protein C2S51_029361 [Perilla frutescens var. frutescens]|nr:hypothetical protein C2S51_029361 [Perilla frutescens var. frutescens]